MTNRKLKKILKDNTIEPIINKSAEAPKKHLAIRIPKKLILRAAQTAACLALVAVIAVGWVMMVRFIGRPGAPVTEGTGAISSTGSATEPDPGFHVEVTTNEKGGTSIDIVDNGGDFDIGQLSFTSKPLTFFCISGTKFMEVNVTEVNGEFVNDMVFSREEYIKNPVTLGIIHNLYTDSDLLVDGVKTSCLSGTGTGIIIADGYSMTQLATLGLTQNLNDTKYLDLTKGYWPEKLYSDLNINGKLYFVSGNISTNTLTSMYMTIFNRDKIANLGLENPYLMVESGKWTLDKMLAMSVLSYTDLDGDMNATDKDNYGFITSSLGIDALSAAYGLRLIDNSTDALNLSRAFTGGRFSEFCIKLNAAFKAHDAYLSTPDYSATTKSNYIFIIATWNKIIDYRYHTSDFNFTPGMLPLPKYSESSDYITPVSDDAIYYAISSGADTDMCSAVIEYFAYSINDGIGTLLSFKYCFDEESAQNLRVMNNTMTFTLDRVLSSKTGNLASLVPDCAVGGESATNSALNKVNEFSSIISALASAKTGR